VAARSFWFGQNQKNLHPAFCDLCVEICFVVQFLGRIMGKTRVLSLSRAQNLPLSHCTVRCTETGEDAHTPQLPPLPRSMEVCAVATLLYSQRSRPRKRSSGVWSAHFLGCTACWKGRHSHHSKGALLGRRNILESHSRSKFQKRPLLHGREVHLASRSKGKSARYCMVWSFVEIERLARWYSAHTRF
jgi:hypothetical protein